MKRIMEEQDSVFQNNDTHVAASANVTYDHLSDMQLLHDCMREALRLCPPLILLIRLAMVDIPIQSKEGTPTLSPRVIWWQFLPLWG